MNDKLSLIYKGVMDFSFEGTTMETRWLLSILGCYERLFPDPFFLLHSNQNQTHLLTFSFLHTMLMLNQQTVQPKAQVYQNKYR